MVLPFGQTLCLWRLHRSLTQAQLAQAARIPRPNLSAIERGKREVSLGTLRALAAALDVTAGVLVDGIPPGMPGQPPGLSREALERVADSVVRGIPLRNQTERELASLLRNVVRNRTRVALGKRGTDRGGTRTAETAWLRLQASYPPALVRSLLQRIEARQRAHEPEAD